VTRCEKSVGTRLSLRIFTIRSNQAAAWGSARVADHGSTVVICVCQYMRSQFSIKANLLLAQRSFPTFSIKVNV